MGSERRTQLGVQPCSIADYIYHIWWQYSYNYESLITPALRRHGGLIALSIKEATQPFGIHEVKGRHDE